MCRNSVDISSTLLQGTVSNTTLIISKRALRRCSVRLKYTHYIVKNQSDRFSVYLTEACFYPKTTVLNMNMKVLFDPNKYFSRYL